ncbi:hypothetical protein AX17_006324 [Amanita inopinata Kibby_2008]|nr:hypothetical protein AX17_006324 [Amanita inopinata Kibby_2008]
MSKRKQDEEADSGDDSSNVSLIDVDFDFFDPNPSVDYQAIKRLLVQLFHRDADAFSLHDLTELILAQPLGTTVKTDGTESDPYAILTLINMHAHHEHPAIKALAAYFLTKSSQTNSAMHTTLQSLFSQSDSHVGLVICERLVNMPVQVIPPMYRMLLDEILNSISAGKPYKFSHLLFVSRTYHLSDNEESALANSAPTRQSTAANGGSKSKKPKKAKTAGAAGIGEEYDLLTRRPDNGIYPFHPEDPVIMQAAECTMDYKFDKASGESREKDAFGLDTRGRLMLVKAGKMEELVKRMLEVYKVG